MLTETQKTARAQRRVQILTGFYIHIAVYVVVLAGLLAINLVSGAEWWVQWAAAGWGLGILLHALLVFGRLGDRITNWQMRKVYQMKSRM
jgi:hypothetical protein